MQAPAVDPATDSSEAADEAPEHRAAGRLAWLAGTACVACCALPALVAAGLLGGVALAVAAWLPTVALVLAVVAALPVGRTWWRRRQTAGDGHGWAGSACGCASPRATKPAVEISVRSRP